MAYKKFMEADREQIELWKIFIIDLEVTAEQSLNPRRIQEFLTMIFNNGGLDMTVHIMDYIITVRSKMLLIITCYHAFNNANDQVSQAFKTFNDEYQEYLEAFKEVTECNYQPGTSGTLLFHLTRWKLEELEPIFRREGVDFEDLLKMSREEMKEVGVDNFGQRKKLLEVITEFQGSRNVSDTDKSTGETEKEKAIKWAKEEVRGDNIGLVNLTKHDITFSRMTVRGDNSVVSQIKKRDN